jgi:UDP-N-acetylmuramoyl-tripeptide--D-alanyl-D-alanine ligase
VVAAFACAHQLGAPVTLIKERLASFQPLLGRCSTHFIKDGPVFILDTVKAPYHSLYLPINMMSEFKAPRRRIVLGQISDYAGNPRPKYRDAYRASRMVADEVVFVGDHSHRSGAALEDILAGRFVEKRTVEEAAGYIKDTAIPDEIILLKTSRNLHLERIMLNFDHQVRCWEQNCEVDADCVRCGFSAVSFADRKSKIRIEEETKRQGKKQRRRKPRRWEELLTRWLSR